MLEKIKKVRKFANILIVLMVIIGILGVYIKIKNNITEVKEIKTMSVEGFSHMKSPLRIAAIDLSQGTINPIYRPEWTKVESSLDITNKTLTVTLKGYAYEVQSIDANANINYASDVTSTLQVGDITVYINGVNVTSLTKPTKALSGGTITTNPTSGKKEVTHTFTLSNLEEAVRQTTAGGELKKFSEWSGNVAIKIAGRGQASSTYTENVLTDVYGNQSMMETDETGTWVNVEFKDGEIDRNTNGKMFTDFIKPEFTYEYSETTIGDGNHGDTKILTVVFYAADKYFDAANSSLLLSDLELEVDGEEVNINVEGNSLTPEALADGTGIKYTLVVKNLPKTTGPLYNDYSGPVSIIIPANKIADYSGNTNAGKTLTIGIDDPAHDPDHDEEVIVDLVDPIWKVDGEVQKTIDATTGKITATANLIVTDKYFRQQTLTAEQVKVIVDGIDISSIANISRTLTKKTIATEQVVGEFTYKTNGDIYQTVNGTSQRVGERYEFTLGNLEETDAVFLAERAKYATDPSTGRLYREYSGTMKLVIPANTAEDNFGNKNLSLDIPLNHVDTLKPEVIKVSSRNIVNATNVENSKQEIVFDIVDKYLATSTLNPDGTTDLTNISTDDIHVIVDEQQATTVTKTITNIERLTATVNGNSQLVGYRYTLELSNFEKPRTSAVYQKYTDWSGDVSIIVDADTGKDTNGTGNDETELEVGYADFIKPDVTYKYTESAQNNPGDINYEGKTFKMVFEITDKHFANSTLDINDLTIKIDGEVPDWTKVEKDLEEADVTLDGGSEIIGKRYTLVLSKLEQLQIQSGDQYLDYSGVITVEIPQGVATDTNTPTANGNDGTTITSGIDIPGGAVGDKEIVDVVDPLWEKVSSSANAINQTATIKIRGTDKYYASSNLSGKIKVFANGADVTSSVTIQPGAASPIYKVGTTDKKVGDEYEITITGFAQNVNQIKIEIQEDAMLDQSGNGNKVTQMLLYNALKLTSSETGETSAFLGQSTETTLYPKNTTITPIERQNIEKVIFVNSLSTVIDGESPRIWDSTEKSWTFKTGIQRVWDVSAQGDDSILAWTSQTSAPYTVYIGSNDEIFANQNSSYLFSYIGYANACQAIETLDDIELLNTSSVTIMNNMFQYFGHKAMQTLDLGQKFDTQNVTNMEYMFSYCGYEAMETIELRTKFNTTNVQQMGHMFEYCGYKKMKKLDLSSATNSTNTTQFNTSNVLGMQEMFSYCGYMAMETLNLGNNFNAGRVTDLTKMFQYCGYTAMQTLDLGANFNPANATTMESMFLYTGHDAMQTLELGDNFNTSNVQYMQNMFSYCGYKALRSLDLSSATATSNTNQFNTSNVTNMNYMFDHLGHDLMQTLNLGNNFDTGKVTNFRYMFSFTGYESLNSLDLGTKFNTSKGQQMGYMFERLGYKAMTKLKLGNEFNTSDVYDMEYMFYECGFTKLESLDLGNLFDTRNVKTMVNMFEGCGKTEMTALDLGPAFTYIPDKLIDSNGNPTTDSAHINFVTNCGKSGECVIYAPESIYSNRTTFKLNSTSTSTIAYNRGTINPIYKPEWTKVSSLLNEANKTLTITVKGSSYETQTIDETTNINYASNVTSTLGPEDITVFINGVEVTSTTNPEIVVNAGAETTNATTNKTDITHSIVLSKFEEAVRQTTAGGALKKFSEWSGNVAIKIAGRGQATSTYTANVLKDSYGNQSMMATDETGTWIDIEFKDGEINKNTNGTMFADFIKPEFTYEYSETTIGDGNHGDTKILTVVFYAADKYFDSANSSLILSDLEFEVDGEEVDINVEGNSLTPEALPDGTGTKYTLVVKNLPKTTGPLYNDYSGPVSIIIPANKIADYSGNTNAGKTLTIGIDDPAYDPDHDEEVIVDVVDPIWKVDGEVQKTIDATTGKITATVNLIITDKYFKQQTLTAEQVKVIVDGVDISSIANISRTLTKKTIATEQVNGQFTYKTNGDIYQNIDGSSQKVGERYEFALGNLEETDAVFLAERAKYETDPSTGRLYREYSGTMKLVIPANTAEDNFGNKNLPLDIPLNHVDTLKPEVIKVSSRNIVNATNVENSKQEIIFDIVDKYLATSTLNPDGTTNIANVNTDDIHVMVDGTEATTITKTITNIEKFTATVSGNSQLVGYRYTLELSNFENSRTSAVYKKYTDWSGDVSIIVDADTGKDTNGTGNNQTELEVGYADFIKPDVTYKYTESAQNNPGDIDYEGKTFKMIFEITDKHFANSTLDISDLTIEIDGEVPDWTKVEKDLEVADATLDGSSEVIGKRYTLVLSKLEQLQILEGDQYLDYSGVISVLIPQGVVTDTNTTPSANGNDKTKIISGINIPGEDDSDEKIVDVVDPLWQKVSSSASAIDPANPTSSTATITIKGTDKYYKESILTQENIKTYVKVYAQTGTTGAEATDVTSSVDIAVSGPTPIYKTGTTDQQIGDEYTLTIKKFAQNVNQIKIEIQPGAMTDDSGNTNKETQLLVYNVLRLTNTETAETSVFLGCADTNIQRQYIENVTFLSSTSAVPETGWWDVSAARDNSIKAWATRTTEQQTNGTYTVYIASDDEIFANQDSSYLFSRIGLGENCVATQLITNIGLLNTSSVTNMSYMFHRAGHTAMTTFDLGDKFDTSNVTNMEAMFYRFGHDAMTTFNLGTKFNTSKVTNMKQMFYRLGNAKLTELKLERKIGATNETNIFDTTNVTDMEGMFNGCGQYLMGILDLGVHFNTQNVTTMKSMFNTCGEVTLSKLDLGGKFDTKNVEDMSFMFASCGSSNLSEFILGSKFDTKKVTNMHSMFERFGVNKLKTLDLGELFNTSNVTNMQAMFYRTLSANSAGEEVTIDLGEKFNTSKVTDMYRMFYHCGENTMKTLDLGDLFYTTSATNMAGMFLNCGATAMTTLDLGPAFTKIPTGTVSVTVENVTSQVGAHDDFITNTGKSGCIIYAPESIYKNKNAFKLNTADTTNSISYTIGTINPIYRPEWTKVSSSLDVGNKEVSINLKGTAYKTETVVIEGVSTEVPIYSSDVTTALTANDITVYINGEEASSIVKTLTQTSPAADPATGEQSKTGSAIEHTLKLSNLEQAIRQTTNGVYKNFKEWSGNISIKIGGRENATSTYTANKLIDKYGNQSMSQTDETGTWIDVIYKDTDINVNTNGTMFADYIKPEFTYEYAKTTIDYGLKTVKVVFDVTDKYFSTSQLSTDTLASLITVKLDEDISANTTITKALAKKEIAEEVTENGITYKTNGDIYYIVNGASQKVGERYELTVTGLDRGDGYHYSGPMSLTFPADIITDLSSNKNEGKTITIGVDDPENGSGNDSEEIVDVVDPIIWMTQVNGLNLSYVNGGNSIDRVNDQVLVTIRGTDKYLNRSTLSKEKVSVRVRKHDGTVVENAATVESVTRTRTVLTGTDNPYIEYQILLSGFGTNDGLTSLIIAEDVMIDNSNNGNLQTEVYVGNASWADGDYTGFNNSIVDFIDPIWQYSTSSITRDRAGQTGTVAIKILGSDNYYFRDTLDEDKIKVYIDNVENGTVEKSLAKITDGVELGDADTGYVLTLSNFGNNQGQVRIDIEAGSIRDTSGNGNILTPIQVGNVTWIENDVETDVNNLKYTAFRDSIVDFIKPVISYKYEAGVNPVLDRTTAEEKLHVTFDVTDPKFLSSNIGEGDIRIFVDVNSNEREVTSAVTKSMTSQAITNGIRYTLTLSKFELEEVLEGEIFKRHSGVVKLVIPANKVEDTSGNKNNETTIIIDNDNGDDVNNGIIVDFIDPIIYYESQYINWNDRYAEITVKATDRFYDTNTKLLPTDITLYEENVNGQWIQVTDFDNGKISITSESNGYGYDFTIKLSDFEEEYKMKISIPANKIGDTSLNYNQATDIIVALDNKKPRWQYVSSDTTRFESEGKISFNVKGVDKFLNLTDSKLEVEDLKILLDGQNLTTISGVNIAVNERGTDTTEKSKSYEVVVSGLTEGIIGRTVVGTYSLIIAEKNLIDEFLNESSTTTISFSKSAIASNTGNYKNITYHISPDNEMIHASYVHELMSVNTTGTNFENTKFRPSTIGEIHNNGENPLFAEPHGQSFAGWAVSNEIGTVLHYTDATCTVVSEEETEFTKVYGLYDEIPNTVDHLKAIWQDATIIYVSNSGSDSNSGTDASSPVKTIENAFSKLNPSGTTGNNIVVIMNAVEWDSNDTLNVNATITSLYAGIDYRLQGAELKISSNMATSADLVFDNIKLYANSTNVSDGTDYLARDTYTNMLIANYADITIGRRVTTPTDKYTFGAIIGGNYKQETTTGQIGTHTIRVEAGRFNNILAGSSLTTSSTAKMVTHEVIIGNMRDSAVSRNDKLTITGYVAMGENELKCYPAGSTGVDNAYNKNYSNVTLYSGTFTGENAFNKESEDIAIYLRSIDGQVDGTVKFEMFGGEVNANIYAGSRSANKYPDITANAMKFYGGKVVGNIFGQGANDTFAGGTEITLQGIINVTGSVFGGSNVTDEGTGDGEGDVSIIVNSTSARVTANIYGGSNGISNSGYLTGLTNITVKAGTLTNIYGSGNNAGNSGSTNIRIENGTISGNIIGGAYNGQVGTAANITIVGGTVSGNIFGGNQNTSQDQLTTDNTSQDAIIIIGNASALTTPTINGIIYGGGAYDKQDTVTIELIKCANTVSVYGASNANTDIAQTNITLDGMTVNQIYGGGQSAGTVEEANIYLKSGTVTDVYGGGHAANVTTSNILLGVTEIVEDEDTGTETETIIGNAIVGSIYGGANSSGVSSGIVETSNVTLKSGTLTNVFGGGNSASVGTANVTLDGITIDTIHGGSKDAGETTTTNVILTSGEVENVYGGGLDVGVGTSNITHQGATVTTIYGGNNSSTGDGGNTGTTNINIINSEVENVYGGNYLKGTTRYTNITIQGVSKITGKLYGGGYLSEIGNSTETGSTTINITGGIISGDINGGSEQSIVYGTTNINIGKDAVTDTTLNAGSITIGGNIYGAGDSALAVNRDNIIKTKNDYNYDYVSVVGDTHIMMDNSEDSPITFSGSIFGAGNGTTYDKDTDPDTDMDPETDNSTIHLKDFGTLTTDTDAYQLVSIERTGKLYIGTSKIELLGRQDVNNFYAKTSYTLNRITKGAAIYANTTLYTRRGFNMVGGFDSYKEITSYGATTKATATISGGIVTKNVDNRLYTMEGINLIFAKQEGDIYATNPLADIWGDVNGMTFFGMYTINRKTGDKQVDIYDPNYTTGAVKDFFKNGTFVEGRHKASHNIGVDGFYTNVAEYGAEIVVTPEVIETTDYGKYYDWIIGADIVTYDISLKGSISGDYSMAEVLLDYQYLPSTTYTLNKVSANALNTDVKLINKLNVPTISDKSHNTFGLTIETGTSGWLNKASTDILTRTITPENAATLTDVEINEGLFTGDSTYKSDTTNKPASIKFKLYNSINITENKDLGNVNLRFTAKNRTAGDPSEGNTFIVVIAVNLQTLVEEQKQQYTPSFTGNIESELNYTTDSRIDLSYILYKEVTATPYATGDYRVLSTTMQLPIGTKITLKDYGQGDNVNAVYYYHVTSLIEPVNGKYIYKLSDFLVMDSTNTYYQNSNTYYHADKGYVLEKYDVSIDFRDSNITANKLEQETYLELRNSLGNVKFNNGDTTRKYNLYYNKNAIMTETISNENNVYSVVEDTKIPFRLDISLQEQKTDEEDEEDREIIKDTKYYDKIAGIAVEILDIGGTRIRIPEAQDVKIVNTDDPTEEYLADESGVIRIPLLEGFSTLTKNYEMSISQYNVPPGKCSVNVYFFASDNGEHYGDEVKIAKQFYTIFVNRQQGLVGVEATDNSRIINKSTGLNLDATEGVDMTVTVGDPTNETNVRVELYKRNPTYAVSEGVSTYNGTSYVAVDIKNFLGGTWETPEQHGLTTTAGTIEYIVSPRKTYVETEDFEVIEFERALKEGISTGEYKLIFKSYYDDVLVQTVRKTFIVTE